MAIPAAILRKPAKLNPEETKIMQEHPYRGYMVLQKVPFLREAAEIVWAHHENFDGTGYPRSLEGEEIPVGAPIVAIQTPLTRLHQTSLMVQPSHSRRQRQKSCAGLEGNSTLK